MFGDPPQDIPIGTQYPAGNQSVFPVGSPGYGLSRIWDWLSNTDLMDKIRKSTLEVKSPNDLTPSPTSTTVTAPGAKDIGPSPIYSQGQISSQLPESGKGPVIPGTPAATARTQEQIDAARQKNAMLSQSATALEGFAKSMETPGKVGSPGTAPSGRSTGISAGRRLSLAPFLAGSPSTTSRIFGGF